jgi:glucosamine--fructose-6-phosphate aminotransferase (isomerizing)
MKLQDSHFGQFALVREMLDTAGLIGRINLQQSAPAAAQIRRVGKLFLTGEGSSRIFPAKNLIYEVLRRGLPLSVFTDGARQAHEYRLADYCVFAASNSGQTKEVISLFTQLSQQGHQARFGLTANAHTKLEDVSNQCFQLACGKEDAVAATKSVVEQALFYASLLLGYEDGTAALVAHQQQAAQLARQVLEADLDPKIVDAIAAAPVIYFAGRNNGVAEELTLKTNEITRKKSDFLEGTYAVHGIEEVMNPNDVVLVVDPFPAEAEKFKQVLVDGVGMHVIAIAATDTLFPTIKIPTLAGYDTVLQLLAGWNVLVHVGVAAGINLDKPERARKIGNEFLG